MANPGPKWPTRIGTTGPLDRVAQIADRSALASREKCPCFQFARLLRSRPSGVRGPVLLPP